MNTSIATLLAGKGRAIHTVPSTVTVTEAVQKMNQHRIGAVLVLDESAWPASSPNAMC